MEYYHQLHDLLNPSPYITPNPSQEAGDVHHQDNILGRDRDRPPQWTHDETKELLALRGQLDQSFIQTKRNKSLWQAISTQLQEKGFHRTPDQCKSKWKNLVSRYKESESMERVSNKQIPFYEEMSTLFSERMERLLDFEKGKGKETVQWEEEDDINEYREDQRKAVAISSRSKKRKDLMTRKYFRSSDIEELQKDVEIALRDFIQRQIEMETRWMEEAEAREAERRAKEEEWRRWMQALQTERMEAERKWREQEDARRARAEAREERRHALIMALLDRLAKQGV